MTETGIREAIEDIVREHVGPGHELREGPVWLAVRPVGATVPDHGWKLHISARAANFADLTRAVLPVLLAEGCVFKLARSTETLGTLNDGHSSPATVGKAFTIYPAPDRVRELGSSLARSLHGFEGPRVLSDRQVVPDAPVYYRYGPFVRGWGSDARGRLTTAIHGPAGEEFGALATLRYRQPSWATDPFTGETAEQASTRRGDAVLGGRYRVLGGVYESGRGNVYRAHDERDGATVIVKQARAHVDEHGDRGDVRLRLRNERRILTVLDGVAGVPRFIDHFKHGGDEFLVTTDAGPMNLADDVLREGRYLLDPTGERSLARLGGQLARILLDVHARGVVMRDLAPKNIVVDGDRVSIVDFGLAAHADVYIPGATYGFAPARQRRDEPPRDTDDFFALGMTLLVMVNYVYPVTLGEDHELAALRARQSIRAQYGETPTGIMALIAELLGDDPATQRQAAHVLAGQGIAEVRGSVALPAPPAVTPNLARDLTTHLRAELLGQIGEVLTASPQTSIAHDACVYSGSAGIGLELLAHLDHPGVPERVTELARFTVTAMTDVDLPPGLLVGRTGADVFLSRAREHGIDVAAPAPGLPDPDWQPHGTDLIVGAAGVGIGALILHDATGDPAHLDLLDRCLSSIMDSERVESAFGTEALPQRTAIDPTAGRAHGLAGVVELLLYAAAKRGDEAVYASAVARTAVLARRAETLIGRASGRYALPLAMSWCQGLAGIAQTLLHAGDVLADARLIALARQAGDVCIATLPRLSVSSQCCGAAGVGNLLIDLATHEHEQRYRNGADAVLRQMLLRGAGPADAPVFVDGPIEDGSASLSFGTAGILTFVRRLADEGGPIALPLPRVTC